MKALFMSLSCVAAIALIAFAAPPANAAHVDFFDAGPFVVAAASGETQVVTQTAPNADILGGLRQVTLINTGGPVPNVAGLVVDSPDVLDDAVSATFGSPGSVEFEYGAFTSAGPLNANFLNIPNSGLNWTHIEVDFDLGTLGGGNATVTLMSGSTTASLTQTIVTGDNDLMFLYSDFLAQAPGLNLTDIDAARLLINAGAGENYVVSFFGRAGVIPTPAALPAGLALLGAIGMIRRHRPKLRPGS